MLFLIAAGCSAADSGPVFTADEVRSPTTTPTTPLVVPLTTVPLTDAPPAGPVSTTVVLDLISSPADGVAEIVGGGAVSTDLVTVDGVNAAFLSFENAADGGFVATVSIIGDGQHTVCIAETCGVLDLPG